MPSGVASSATSAAASALAGGSRHQEDGEWPSLTALVQAVPRAAAEFSADVHEHVLGMPVQESTAFCCGGLARSTSKASEALDKAERSLSVASHAVTHDTRPARAAAGRTTEARELIDGLGDDSSDQALQLQGPYQIQQVESVQSAVTRRGDSLSVGGPEDRPTNAAAMPVLAAPTWPPLQEEVCRDRSTRRAGSEGATSLSLGHAFL